ncbi:MAG: dihydrofolate reductase family protein [Methanotrichaceae archaeon]|nr:dihydrofolate reductase family protein [Methanotrichaceae archaeon]
MRKIIAFENVSLDGYFAGPNGEIDWFVASSHTGSQTEEDEFAIDSIKSTNTLLFGRVTYELMASYWPTADAMKNNPILAERINNVPKIVFSRTLDTVKWQNTRLIRDNIEEEIEGMKNQPGKNIAILGSGSIVSVLAKRGLIDEYSFMVNPVILGSGRSIFQGIENRLHLKLVETRTFKSGNVLLRYQFIK